MNVDKEKCIEWSKLMLQLFKMTKDLNEAECRYIKAKFSIAFGRLELQELQEQKIIE